MHTRITAVVLLIAVSSIPALANNVLPNKPVPQAKVHTIDKEFVITTAALGAAWFSDMESTSRIFRMDSSAYEAGHLFTGSRSIPKIFAAWGAVDAGSLIVSYEWKKHVHNKYLHPLWRVPMYYQIEAHGDATHGNWQLQRRINKALAAGL